MAFRNQNPYLGTSDPKWKDQRFDYASGNLDYRGTSLIHKSSSSTGNLWSIWKYTYSSTSTITRIEGPLSGNWDDRATLNWA